MKAQAKLITVSEQEMEIADHFYQKDLSEWYESENYTNEDPPLEPDFKWKWGDFYFSPFMVCGPMYIDNDGHIRVQIADMQWIFKYDEELYIKLQELIDVYNPRSVIKS